MKSEKKNRVDGKGRKCLCVLFNGLNNICRLTRNFRIRTHKYLIFPWKINENFGFINQVIGGELDNVKHLAYFWCREYGPWFKWLMHILAKVWLFYVTLMWCLMDIWVKFEFLRLRSRSIWDKMRSPFWSGKKTHFLHIFNTVLVDLFMLWKEHSLKVDFSIRLYLQCTPPESERST